MTSPLPDRLFIGIAAATTFDLDDVPRHPSNPRPDVVDVSPQCAKTPTEGLGDFERNRGQYACGLVKMRVGLYQSHAGRLDLGVSGHVVDLIEHAGFLNGVQCRVRIHQHLFDLGLSLPAPNEHCCRIRQALRGVEVVNDSRQG